MAHPRWKEIVDFLLEEIEAGRYLEGSRIPTNSQLAEQMGVSPLTAHKALEELQRLGVVIRSGRRGTIVSDTRKKRTGRIALIVDQIDYVRNFPRPELLEGIHDGLGSEYSLLICDSKASAEREQELLRQMATETDGILCWSTGQESTGATVSELVEKHIPLVLLDRVPGNVHADAVITNSVAATKEAAEFLIERGHRRVGLITFDKPEISTVAERCGTFERVMAEHGIASADLVRRLPASLEVEDRAHFEQVFHDALFALLNGPSPATAVLCVQDLIGVAVLKYAEEADLRVPKDLEIVTFNDWPPHWLCHPWQAHRIAVQPGDMGRLAISRLKAQIEGDAGELGIHYIPTVFVPADSLVGSAFDLHPDRPQEVS